MDQSKKKICQKVLGYFITVATKLSESDYNRIKEQFHLGTSRIIGGHPANHGNLV